MSTRRHRIVHRTTMRYPDEVTASHNELRMIPVNEPGQTALESRVRVRPLTWSHLYTDHWGTEVMAMESQTPHEALDIEATSLVERYEVPVEVDEFGWEALEQEHVRDRLSEYLAPTPRTRPAEDLVELAEQVRSSPTPRAAALALGEHVHGRMTYEPGSTKVQGTAAEAWALGMGVCQDFAHIIIGGLRAIEVPARYVSGYAATGGEDSRAGVTVAGESHAWIEYWDGAWLPIDPTDLEPVGLDHVVVGRGRDYDDVAPFRGMYVGPELSDLEVEVSITRLT